MSDGPKPTVTKSAFVVGIAAAQPIAIAVSPLAVLDGFRARLAEKPGTAELRDMRMALGRAFVARLLEELNAINDAARLADAHRTIEGLRNDLADAASRRKTDEEIVKALMLTGAPTLSFGCFVALFSITVNPILAVVPAAVAAAVTLFGEPLFRRAREQADLCDQLKKILEAIESRM